MDKLPGWGPITALALLLVLAGSAVFAAGLLIGLATSLVGSGSAGGFGALAGVGFGLQLILLGSLVGAVSMGTHWAAVRCRACLVRSSL